MNEEKRHWMRLNMGTAALSWRHPNCFGPFFGLVLDLLKKIKRYFHHGARDSFSSSQASITTSEDCYKSTTDKQLEEEDDDELFEINLDAVARRSRDDDSPISSPLTIRFANNHQVLLANCFSTAMELSAAIPVAEPAPPRPYLAQEMMAKWVLGEECCERSSSFRELASNIRRLISLKVLSVSAGSMNVDGNRWDGGYEFKMEELFGDIPKKGSFPAK